MAAGVVSFMTHLGTFYACSVSIITHLGRIFCLSPVSQRISLLAGGSLSGLTPAEIVTITPDFIQDTGLNVSLTPSRANGFYNIFQMMKNKALACELSKQAEAN